MKKMCLKSENITQKKISRISNKYEQQNLLRYEIIRQKGKYNMFEPRTIQLTGLTEKEYKYILVNYERLIKKYPNTRKLARRKLKNKFFQNVFKSYNTNNEKYKIKM